MKGTDHFKELIKNYLDNRAKEDELFRVKYETTTRTIDDVVNYIFHAVQQSGCCGFSDMEVYAMAVHAIDEPNLEIGKPMDCNVVVNHHIELTEEEKAEQRAIALKRYQEEEMRKLQQRNSRPKAAKPQPKPIQELSLFQGEYRNEGSIQTCLFPHGQSACHNRHRCTCVRKSGNRHVLPLSVLPM